MVCEFTELSHNTLLNRILKTTLRNLLFTNGISCDHKNELRGLLRVLHEVDSIRIRSQLFRRIQYHQNLREYRLLMNICELVYESLIPTEQAGQATFQDFIRDPKKMPKLFEAFVFNFYQQELQNYKVGRTKFKWQDVTGDANAFEHIPMMQTDVEIESDDDLRILDCKYYKEAFTHHWETERYKTANLYQLYAYMMNKQIQYPELKVSGILLYPQVNQSFTEHFNLQGHDVIIASINLNQPWRNIHNDLKALILDKPPQHISKKRVRNS
jgi:5-methylcytosine-specific restriction enzyme subunit McrC